MFSKKKKNQEQSSENKSKFVSYIYGDVEKAKADSLIELAEELSIKDLGTLGKGLQINPNKENDTKQQVDSQDSELKFGN